MKYTATILAVAALFSPAIFAHDVSTVNELQQEIVAGINAYLNSTSFKTTDLKMTSTQVAGGNSTVAATDIANLATAANIKSAILGIHCTNNNATQPTCVPAAKLADVYSWKVAPGCKNISANLFDLKAYGPVNVTIKVDNAGPAGSPAATHSFNGTVTVPTVDVAKEILTSLVQSLNLNDFANNSVSNNASVAWCSCACQSYYFSNYSNAKNASELFKGMEDPASSLTAGTQQYLVDTVQRKCFAFVSATAASSNNDARALIASAVASTIATVAVVASFL